MIGCEDNGEWQARGQRQATGSANGACAANVRRPIVCPPPARIRVNLQAALTATPIQSLLAERERSYAFRMGAADRKLATFAFALRSHRRGSTTAANPELRHFPFGATRAHVRAVETGDRAPLTNPASDSDKCGYHKRRRGVG
jgi:hypothetical protein